MQHLVKLNNNQTTTTSLIVAEHFGKLHKDVLKAIDNLELPDDYRKRNFAPTFNIIPGPNGSSREERSFEITRDGFAILAMGFTGKAAMEWKVKFLQAFNAMEQEIVRLHAENTRLLENRIEQQRTAYIELKGEIGSDAVEFYSNKLESTLMLLGEKTQLLREKEIEISKLKAKPKTQAQLKQSLAEERMRAEPSLASELEETRRRNHALHTQLEDLKQAMKPLEREVVKFKVWLKKQGRPLKQHTDLVSAIDKALAM